MAGGHVDGDRWRRARAAELGIEREERGEVDLGEERRKWEWEERIEATRREGILIPSSARRVVTSGFDGDRSRGLVE